MHPHAQVEGHEEGGDGDGGVGVGEGDGGVGEGEGERKAFHKRPCALLVQE